MFRSLSVILSLSVPCPSRARSLSLALFFLGLQVPYYHLVSQYTSFWYITLIHYSTLTERDKERVCLCHSEGFETKRPKSDVFTAQRSNLDHVGRCFKLLVLVCVDRQKLSSCVQNLANKLLYFPMFRDSEKHPDLTQQQCLVSGRLWDPVDFGN